MKICDSCGVNTNIDVDALFGVCDKCGKEFDYTNLPKKKEDIEHLQGEEIPSRMWLSQAKSLFDNSLSRYSSNGWVIIPELSISKCFEYALSLAPPDEYTQIEKEIEDLFLQMSYNFENANAYIGVFCEATQQWRLKSRFNKNLIVYGTWMTDFVRQHKLNIEMVEVERKIKDHKIQKWIDSIGKLIEQSESRELKKVLNNDLYTNEIWINSSRNVLKKILTIIGEYTENSYRIYEYLIKLNSFLIEAYINELKDYLPEERSSRFEAREHDSIIQLLVAENEVLYLKFELSGFKPPVLKPLEDNKKEENTEPDESVDRWTSFCCGFVIILFIIAILGALIFFIFI